MRVRALRDCYVGGLRHERDEFDYSGPKNGNLEPVKAPKQPSEEKAPETDK